MIYLDTSVALAHLFGEDRAPGDALWREPLVSSRLLQYELWNRLNARGGTAAMADAAWQLVNRLTIVELTPQVLDRALSPFPVPVRTLDALHLATMDYLRRGGQQLEVATYDERLARAAQALGVEPCPLP